MGQNTYFDFTYYKLRVPFMVYCLLWWRGSSNSIKLWTMACRVTKRQMGQWRVVHWRWEWQITLVFLPWELHEQWKVKVKVIQLCLTLCNPMDCKVHAILQARILEWVACPFSRGFSQTRNQTQVSHIAGGFFTSWAHKKNPRILEWVAYPFSRGSSWPRNQTGASCIAGRFFIKWLTRESVYKGKKIWHQKMSSQFWRCPIFY